MNLFDFIIIYLACGAPFGVYYFLQNRNLPNNKFFFLKIVFNFVCWIPFAVSLISKKNFFSNLFDYKFDHKVVLDAERETEIFSIKRFYEIELFEKFSQFSIFEFREVFDRYVGLTLEANSSNQEIADSVRDFYQISESPNKKLAENCLQRRNRQRLFFHQTLARNDFWELIGKIFNNSQNRAEIFDKSSHLIELLKDSESNFFLQRLSAKGLQTLENDYVSETENELWKTEQQQPIPAQPISVNIKALTATMNLSNKD